MLISVFVLLAGATPSITPSTTELPDDGHNLPDSLESILAAIGSAIDNLIKSLQVTIKTIAKSNSTNISHIL
uniref:Secreted protein n=1 Tax=Ditylenchus dipsaci TaxID=166011 RepID=A0A915D8Y1_9BILA